MPKRFLHDMVTNHNHTTTKTSDTKPAINKAGFNCQCDDLVAGVPFASNISHFNLAAPISYFLPQNTFYSFQLAVASKLYHTLRGPPSLV